MTKKQSQKERKLLYRATHKLLCPQCEGKTPKQLMFEYMAELPFLVKSKCSICGYEGMFIEVRISKVEDAKSKGRQCPLHNRIRFGDEHCKVTVCNGECHPNYGKGSSV